MLYKGFIETKGKRSKEPLKGRTQFKTLEQVQHCDGYAGVLADDTILIDIDDGAQAEKLMNVVEALQLNCKVYQTSRGKHFLFKNKGGQVTRNRTHVPLAIGLTADIKLGMKTSYEVIKIDGQERFCEWDIEPGAEYQELPTWLIPVKTSADFVDMEAGDGRNDALFKYILTLTGNGMTVDETRECIKLMNQFVLKEPLEESELDTILRDEAFQKPVFFVGSTFQFDKFAHWMKQNSHAVKINDQLHIYHDGVYISDPEKIETDMIETIPILKQTQRNEVMKYMRLIADELEPSDARYIGFRNGVLDVVTNTMQSYSPETVLTNMIPWDYVPDAYDELTDKTLNKLACGDETIRALLEECVGYCFYRRNELGKAFILTGDKANGKSTFLEMVKNVLGERNISALDLKELGDRFNTAMLYGKLANIGDDIGDDFLQGSQVAMFKKIATGNRIKAEYKGQTPFEFNPYVKMLFSANDIPRMRDKTGAVLRRLVIIPFNNVFSKDDPDYDPWIVYKLKTQNAVEYLIRVGIEGLRRVLTSNSFTESSAVQEQVAEYEEENNPLVGFLKENGAETIVNQPTSDVYRRYQIFCSENGMQPMSNTVFSKQLNKRLRTDVKVVKINGKVCRVFVKG